MEKISIELSYPNDITMSVTVKNGNNSNTTSYRHMSGEYIPIDIQYLMIPKLVSGAIKNLEYKTNNNHN